MSTPKKTSVIFVGSTLGCHLCDVLRRGRVEATFFGRHLELRKILILRVIGAPFRKPNYGPAPSPPIEAPVGALSRRHVPGAITIGLPLANPGGGEAEKIGEYLER